MTDEKYMFISDSRDKKITARSARHTRTHCGKGGTVKFPSDYLSRKELKAMSGECIKYASLKKPMSWEEFKVLPDDLKREYIASIRDRFGCPDQYIAEMFGVHRKTLSLYLVDLKCNPGKRGNMGKWDKEKFYAWRSGADEGAVQEATDEAYDDVEANICQLGEVEDDIPVNEASEAPTDVVEESIEERIRKAGPIAFAGNPIPVIPKGGTMTFQSNDVSDILTTLNTLLSGVRVNMTVTWECIYE